MPLTLTTQDRARITKLASSMPAGSAERKAILAGLAQTKQASGEINIPGKHISGKHMHTLSSREAPHPTPKAPRWTLHQSLSPPTWLACRRA